MGVVGGVTRVDGTRLAELCESPADLSWYLHGWEPTLKQPGLLARLLGRKPQPAPPPRPLWVPPPKGDEQYLDKAWHAIHYLLAGSAAPSEDPRSFLLSGSTVDLGNSQVIVHDAARTEAIAASLQGVDRRWLTERWDQAAMTLQDVYLMDRLEEDDAETFEYVVDYALQLVEFVREAARRRCGLVVDING
jgi:hypothetical protein